MEALINALNPKEGGAYVNKTAVRVIWNTLNATQQHALLFWTNSTSLDQLLKSMDPHDEVSYREHEMKNHIEMRLEHALLIYIPPIILILGTFGNILSFVILTRRPMRRFSTYIYLAILSLTDTFVLYIGLMRLWMNELVQYDVMIQADWVCKLFMVTGYTVSDYSVWLIVAVTAERYVAVCYPLKAPIYCNRKRAAHIIIILLAVLLSINLHFIWTTKVQPFNGIPSCAGLPGYELLVNEIWPWVDACMYSIIPSTVILVLNALIIRSVVHARKSRTQMASINADSRRAVGGGSGSGSQDSSYRLTFMLLTISFAFLITTFPMTISGIAVDFYQPFFDDRKVYARFRLIRTITELLMYVNHSMNFFLYCATGNKFRQQLLRLLCRYGDIQRMTTFAHGTGANGFMTHRTMYSNDGSPNPRCSGYSPRPLNRLNSQQYPRLNNRAVMAQSKHGDYVQVTLRTMER